MAFAHATRALVNQVCQRRPIALGRKNHLFAGSDGGGVRWATVCSLIATAKLNDVEPFGYCGGGNAADHALRGA